MDDLLHKFITRFRFHQAPFLGPKNLESTASPSFDMLTAVHASQTTRAALETTLPLKLLTCYSIVTNLIETSITAELSST